MWTHLPSTLSASPEKTIDLGPLAEAHLDSLPKTKITVDNTTGVSASNHEVMLPASGRKETRFLTGNKDLCPNLKESPYCWWIQVPHIPEAAKIDIYGVDDTTPGNETNRNSDYILFEAFRNKTRWNYTTFATDSDENNTPLNGWDTAGTAGTSVGSFQGFIFQDPCVIQTNPFAPTGGATSTLTATNTNTSGQNFGTGTCLRAIFAIMSMIASNDGGATLYVMKLSDGACSAFTYYATAGPHTAGVIRSGTSSDSTFTFYGYYNSNSSSTLQHTQTLQYRTNIITESGHFGSTRYGRASYVGSDNTIGPAVWDGTKLGTFSTVAESAPSASRNLAVSAYAALGSNGTGPYCVWNMVWVRHFIYPEPTVLIAGGG